MLATTTVPIHLDERGVAWINDTNTKVVEVVLDKMAYGWSPEEIHHQHAHLSMAQSHAALSYYYDHQQAIDNYIKRQRQWTETMAAQAGDSPVRQRLRGWENFRSDKLYQERCMGRVLCLGHEGCTKDGD